MQVVKDGECWRWTGTIDDRGRPLQVFTTPDGSTMRTLAYRPIWCSYWSVPHEQLHARRLAPVCSNPLCCHPCHRILAAPSDVHRALHHSVRFRRGLRRTFIAEGTRGGLRGSWWRKELAEAPEAGQRFAPPREVVAALAQRFRTERIAILAVWSHLVRHPPSKEDADGGDEGTLDPVDEQTAGEREQGTLEG